MRANQAALVVMAGPVAVIHVLLIWEDKTWMPGLKPGMTVEVPDAR
jgi:hypothetical protein